MQIPTPEIVYPGTKCKGEPSYVNELKPISLQEVHFPVKKNFKNWMKIHYPLPKSNKYKLMWDETMKDKKTNDKK